MKLTKLMKKYKINEITDLVKIYPDQKRFKSLIFSYENYIKEIDQKQLVNIYDRLFEIRSIDFFIVGSILIKNKINSDLVFNELKKHVDSLISLDFIENQMDMDRFVSNRFVSFLKSLYNDQRIISLVLGNDFSEHEVKDILTAYKELMSNKKKKDEIANNIIKKPKSIKDLHDSIMDYLEFINIEKNLKVKKLNQREDFINFENLEFTLDNMKLRIDIPKTNLDLLNYSKIFDNCVGKHPVYADGCIQQRHVIFGIFHENKPLFCIQSTKYSFKQIKGVSNCSVPVELVKKLESLLTKDFEIPKDFEKVDHSFVAGYKYIKKNGNLFVIFTKKDKEDFSIYEYEKVSESDFNSFIEEKNKGKALNKYIKKYNCYKVG